MLYNFREIYEGWKNDLLPKDSLRELIKQVSEERNSICVKCKAYDTTGTGCAIWGTAPCCNKNVKSETGESGCGCPLKKKQKALQARCPWGKWDAIVTEKEAENIKLDKDGE
jgi:hypothetical protein